MNGGGRPFASDVCLLASLFVCLLACRLNKFGHGLRDIFGSEARHASVLEVYSQFKVECFSMVLGLGHC